jgi:OOP family OmpA-OmpF porin
MRRAEAEPTALSDLKITFKLGSAELSDAGKATATNFADALKSLPQTRYEIAGYTDVTGQQDRNLALSQSRADAVKQFLVSKGVDSSRLETKGFGPTHLADPARPASPANRRVEAHSLN